MQAVRAHRLTAPSFFGQKSQAEFVFSRDAAGRTYLSRQFVPYPFHICRSTYVEKDPPGMATLYVQSCAAGLLQHDDLTTSLVVEEGAQVHFTTGAQTIVHSMDEGQARQETRVEAFDRSLAEYMPEPLILFPQARLRSSVRIVAHEGSSVIAGESFIVHDYGGGERMFDWFNSELLVERPSGELLARDRFHLEGAALKRGLPGVNGPFLAQGSLVILGAGEHPDSLVTAVRSALEPLTGVYAGASALRAGCGGAWVRILASDGLALHTAMIEAWMTARTVLTGLKPTPRRKC